MSNDFPKPRFKLSLNIETNDRADMVHMLQEAVYYIRFGTNTMSSSGVMGHMAFVIDEDPNMDEQKYRRDIEAWIKKQEQKEMDEADARIEEERKKHRI